MLDKILDLPAASLIVLIAGVVVGGIIAIVNPDVLSYEDYMKSLGALAAGAGVLGIARNQAGRGLSKKQ